MDQSEEQQLQTHSSHALRHHSHLITLLVAYKSGKPDKIVKYSKRKYRVYLSILLVQTVCPILSLIYENDDKKVFCSHMPSLYFNESLSSNELS